MLGVIFGNQFDIDQRYQGKRAEKARIDEIVASGDSETSICLVGRTHHVLEVYAAYLRENGIAVYEVKRSAAEQREKPGVRVATMWSARSFVPVGVLV